MDVFLHQKYNKKSILTKFINKKRSIISTKINTHSYNRYKNNNCNKKY